MANYHISVGVILSMVLLALARGPEPAANKYAKIPGQYVGKATLGQSLRVSPAECAQICDVTPRCMGLNYYTRRGRCEMLTHNIETVPSHNRIKINPDIDHYVRLDADYQCPDGAFPHPYKPRCYEVVNTPLDYYSALKHCSKNGGQLALIPNKLTRHAIWSEVTSRMTSDSVWLGIQFARKESYLKRAGKQAFFMWFSNLLRGKPQDNKAYCGAALKNENGKFDYYSCKESRSFLCEYRTYTDTELNELCPGDTALFDGNCYWSEDSSMTPQAADTQCADRGGRLAAFPSIDAIEFIGTIWEHVIPNHITESWVGLNYHNNDKKWYWTDGEEDMDLARWNSADEMAQGPQESCGTALRVGNGDMKWLSRPCKEQHTFLCMGQSGIVMSRDCATKECPRNSVCNEGPFEASCVCKPGYVSLWQNGKLICRSSAVCQASGDPHYYPWDGGKIHYQGLCEHLLTGTCPEAPPAGLAKFMVKVFNARRDGFSDRVAFTEYTTVEVYDTSIQMGIDGLVLENKQRRIPEFVVYPYNNDKWIKIIVINGGFRMSTDFGLTVTYKNYRVTVEAPDDYANTTCGICGNWNGIPEDDWGHDQDKWLLPGDRNKPECGGNPEPPVCTPEQEEKADKWCGKIHTLPILEECRQRHPDDLASFYDDCMEDACAGNFKDAICNTMEAIIQVCLDYGCEISPSYRAMVQCELTCPPNSSYKPQMSLDVATCQNPDALYLMSSGIGEDCQCDEGFVKEGLACKPIKDCGCLYEDIYLEIDEEYINEDCSLKIICREGGEVIEEPISCADNAECKLNGDGDYECICEDGYEGDGFVECEEIDDGTGDPHFMLASHTTGDFFCFDAHGYRDQVWSLIKDQQIGLTVNGKLYESVLSTPEDPVAYFSTISVRFGQTLLVFSRKNIKVNNVETVTWGEQVPSDFVTYMDGMIYLIQVSEGVTLKIKRTKSVDGDFYLGVFLPHHSGLSKEATGVMGQFTSTDFAIEHDIDSDSGKIVFDDNHPSVEVNKIRRFSLAHKGLIDCWLYNAKYGDDVLLGKAKTYRLDDVLDL